MQPDSAAAGKWSSNRSAKQAGVTAKQTNATKNATAAVWNRVKVESNMQQQLDE
ncbi:hypothetical protein GCM10023156_23950 [Novipirellula rosea]|uniref:Uncharacterized protein n=1 Tax=Novipirellula rosea TaxID=1031540 RepID=A0ABP8MQ81_9BACT